MSKFNIDLEQARKRQTLFYLLLASGIIFVSLAVVVPLALVNSTFIEISPKEASQLAELRVTRGQALAKRTHEPILLPIPFKIKIPKSSCRT